MKWVHSSQNTWSLPTIKYLVNAEAYPELLQASKLVVFVKIGR